MKVVQVGNRFIGGDNPCFIVLELGVNFKNMHEAKKLVDAAIEAGGDAIKFQTFHAQTLVMEGAILHDARGIIDQYKEALESEDKMTDSFQTELIRYAQNRGILTFSTPSHCADIDLLNRIDNIPAFKFGSDDLTNIPLLRYAAKLGKPIFLSSGVSNLSEVDEAIRVIKNEGNEQVILLHCVSNYPTKAEDMNLRTMQALAQIFDVPVGLSDHTQGIAVSIAAAALGAKVIEKHFTLEPRTEGPDNFFSMEPDHMKRIINGIKEVEEAMGVSYKEVRESEEVMRINFRKSIYALKDIEPGEKISEYNTSILRPFQGIAAKYFDIICGMSPKRKILKGQAIQWEHFK